jgi:hypothetical protein
MLAAAADTTKAAAYAMPVRPSIAAPYRGVCLREIFLRLFQYDGCKRCEMSSNVFAERQDASRDRYPLLRLLFVRIFGK